MTNQQRLAMEIATSTAIRAYDLVKATMDIGLGYNNSRGAVIEWLKQDGVYEDSVMKRKEITINQEDLGYLCVCAIRYCQGRQTYMPEIIIGICKKCLPMISDEDVNVMIDDCDFQARMHLYGDERIDKPGWIRWRDELLKEKARRTCT